MELERKSLSLELKDDGAEEGAVTAVFSTFNAVDSDGDVTLPGAFEDGAPVKIASWGHKWHELPVGRGEIRTDDERAMMDGHFFVETSQGKETYLTVKRLGELQEWSYGYEVLESEEAPFDGQQVRLLKKLKVFEVTPVFRGAGVDTGTLALKGLPYQRQAELAEGSLADLAAFIERSRSLADLRAKDGRTLSRGNRERLSHLLSQLDEVAGDIKELLEETALPEKTVEHEFLRYQRILGEMAGIAD